MARLDALWGISPGAPASGKGGAEAGELRLMPHAKESRFHPPQVGRPYIFSGGPTQWLDLGFQGLSHPAVWSHTEAS